MKRNATKISYPKRNPFNLTHSKIKTRTHAATHKKNLKMQTFAVKIKTQKT